MSYDASDTGFGFDPSHAQLAHTTFAGHLIAMQQRRLLMEQQSRLVALLLKQIEIESERLENEKARKSAEEACFIIERLRWEAEENERKLREHQKEQIRRIRNLMADMHSSLRMLQKRFP